MVLALFFDKLLDNLLSNLLLFIKNADTVLFLYAKNA